VARCGYAQALPDFLPTLNEVIMMEKMTRKKVFRAAKSPRYHPVLSIGGALGVTSPALNDVAKVWILPQWKEHDQRDTVLSKRSLLVDIGMSDIQMDDVISTVDLLDKLREGTDAYRATHALSC
jgi:allophanate hydrolase subunit 1